MSDPGMQYSRNYPGVLFEGRLFNKHTDVVLVVVLSKTNSSKDSDFKGNIPKSHFSAFMKLCD